MVLRLSGPKLAVTAALTLACAGEAGQLRRDVSVLRGDVERLQRANEVQAEQVRALAERVAALQGPSPMVVLAPSLAPARPAPTAPERPAAPAPPAAAPLVPPGLAVVRLAPEPADDDAPAPRGRPRGRAATPPPVPTNVTIVEPEGALR